MAVMPGARALGAADYSSIQPLRKWAKRFMAYLLHSLIRFFYKQTTLHCCSRRKSDLSHQIYCKSDLTFTETVSQCVTASAVSIHCLPQVVWVEEHDLMDASGLGAEDLDQTERLDDTSSDPVSSSRI